jgi:polyisoprenoid-binding protein YceI
MGHNQTHGTLAASVFQNSSGRFSTVFRTFLDLGAHSAAAASSVLDVHDRPRAGITQGVLFMIRRSALAAALALASCSLCATTYTLEPNHSQGTVRWSHLELSNPTAQFSQVEGTLEFDPAQPTMSSVMVTIPIAHLSSGVPDLDDDLRSARFFDLAKYPNATFKSTRVETTAMANKLKVTGDLSIRGVTKPVTLDVTINKVGTNPRLKLAAVGFDATATLKRSDFGLDKFVPQVSDDVTIHITCQGDEAKGYEAIMKAEAAEAATDAAKAAKK